jgi:pyruvate kinase
VRVAERRIGVAARRRTKIVATLGPATSTPAVLERLIDAGADVLRLNFSHGNHADQVRLVQNLREIARKLNKDVALLGDLQGPKIRIDRFRTGSAMLAKGAAFALDASLGPDDGDEHAVGLTYKTLPADVSPGDVLLLSDGQIVLTVESVAGDRIECRVEIGGTLSNNKGINRQGGGLSAKALTDKDRADIRTAAELGVDYLAVSFPREATDVEEARRLLREAGGEGLIVAKIERAEAVQNFDAIIAAADVIMIARGDLGVELGYAELPGVQKDLIKRARDGNRVVITATQMMESMIHSPMPTRAEVSDVANAVMDGTDAVMLSGETAVGAFPVEAVQAMADTCLGAEKHRVTQVSRHRIDVRFRYVDEAIAMASMYVANHLDVRAIVALTESGSTALWMSRIRSGIPIFALTRHESTRRRVKLYRGVYPVSFDVVHTDPANVVEAIVQTMLERNVVAPGDQVIFTQGELSGVKGGTNTMKIVSVR